MENASKALIIAGAILLSIAIIGIGMYVFQMTSGAITGSADMTEQEVNAYNSTFAKYEGTQSGSVVRSMCDSVRIHNSNTEDVAKIISIGDKTKPEEIDALKAGISMATRYKVTLGYDTRGMINKITYAPVNGN